MRSTRHEQHTAFGPQAALAAVAVIALAVAAFGFYGFSAGEIGSSVYGSSTQAGDLAVGLIGLAIGIPGLIATVVVSKRQRQRQRLTLGRTDGQ